MTTRRRIVLTVLVACLVPAVLDSAGTALQAGLTGEPVHWNAIVWQGSEWLIFGALTPLAFFTSRRFPLRWPFAWRHLAWHVASALVLCLAWATLGMALRWALQMGSPGDDAHRQWLSWVLTSMPWSVFMYFAVAGSVHAFALWNETQASQRAASELETRLAEARLEALQRQLHPHFLFNSLNAITVLVRDGETATASGMIERLSNLLRSVLRRDRAPLIALRDDVQLALDYLAIERERFPDRLRVTCSVHEELLSLQVPILLLQPLVENAVRHGIAPHDQAGHVWIEGRRDGAHVTLQVIDDGPPSRAARNAGVGLHNTLLRLRSLFGAGATCDLQRVNERTVATVRIPIREFAA